MILADIVLVTVQKIKILLKKINIRLFNIKEVLNIKMKQLMLVEKFIKEMILIGIMLKKNLD